MLVLTDRELPEAIGDQLLGAGWVDSSGDADPEAVGGLVAPDGSGRVSDDYSGRIFRIRYTSQPSA